MPFLVPLPSNTLHNALRLPFQATAYAAPSLVASVPAPELDRSQGSALTVDDIPSEKITQFVTAYGAVMKLVRRNESLLSIAETEEDSTRLQQAIETSAAELIEQTGLTRSEYIQLMSLANLDDEFGEKIVVLLQEKP